MKTVYLALCLDKSLPSLLVEVSEKESVASLTMEELLNATTQGNIRKVVVDLTKELMEKTNLNDIDGAYLNKKLELLKRIPEAISFPVVALEDDTLEELNSYAGEVCDCPNCTREREAKANKLNEESNLEAKEEYVTLLSITAHTINQLADASSKLKDPKVITQINDKITELLNTM
jgi:hypothetical protein